jgi:hypothetical protein
MASKFKFRILNGEDPEMQYDTISVKDDLTFYLLSNGIGYLGNTKLFDATNVEIDKLVTNMLEEGYTGDDETVASTKAVIDYVVDYVNEATILTTKFFRDVKSHTIIAEDLTNPAIVMPPTVKVDDVGLLFTADIDSETGNETYFFIPLTDYLQNLYMFESTNSIELTCDENNLVKANLKINKDEKSIKVSETGIQLEKTSEINDGDKSKRYKLKPSADKLITEEALVKYIFDVVMPIVNNAIEDATEDMVTVDIDSINREIKVNGQTYDTLVQAVNDLGATGITITLDKDTATEGIVGKEKSNFSLDLNGKTLLLQDNYVGSAGTQTNAFQLLKNSTITLKNGTIIAEDAKIVIQNYSNLTLDNVEIIGSGCNKYLLSNNYGNIILKNNTKIKALDNMIAFDLYYGMLPEYDNGVTVTIEDSTVVIEGRIEYSKANRALQSDFETKCKLTTPINYQLNIPDGYTWFDNGDGTQTLVAIS